MSISTHFFPHAQSPTFRPFLFDSPLAAPFVSPVLELRTLQTLLVDVGAESVLALTASAVDVDGLASSKFHSVSLATAFYMRTQHTLVNISVNKH
jgi:hypothetical protein